MMKLHLVADTVPRGTTFCQKVPEKVDKKKQQHVSHTVLWTTQWILNYSAALYSTAATTTTALLLPLHCTAMTTTLQPTANTALQLFSSIAATTALHCAAPPLMLLTYEAASGQVQLVPA